MGNYKFHTCKNCGNRFECATPSTCKFNEETPDCPKCFQLLDISKQFVQQFPNSKWTPKLNGNGVSEGSPVELKRDSQESEGEL